MLCDRNEEEVSVSGHAIRRYRERLVGRSAKKTWASNDDQVEKVIRLRVANARPIARNKVRHGSAVFVVAGGVVVTCYRGGRRR